MSRFSLGERLVSCAVSAILGALIGGVLAWLFGVYSNTMGAASGAIDFTQWVLWSAAAFGLVGLLLGPDAGTILGTVISGIFVFEGAPASGRTMLLVALAAAAYGVWWWLAS